MTQNDSPQYLEIARELADRVETIADRIDTDRQIPSEMAAELADNGLFRLLVPRTRACRPGHGIAHLGQSILGQKRNLTNHHSGRRQLANRQI